MRGPGRSRKRHTDDVCDVELDRDTSKVVLDDVGAGGDVRREREGNWSRVSRSARCWNESKDSERSVEDGGEHRRAQVCTVVERRRALTMYVEAHTIQKGELM